MNLPTFPVLFDSFLLETNVNLLIFLNLKLQSTNKMNNGHSLIITNILPAIKQTFLFSGSDISLAYSTNSFRNSSSFIAFSNLSSSYKEKKNACNKIEKESWSPRALHQQQMNSRVDYFWLLLLHNTRLFSYCPLVSNLLVPVGRARSVVIVKLAGWQDNDYRA